MGGLITLPDPVSMISAAKMASLEREAANSAFSAIYSAWISAMWRSGSAKWAVWFGEGQAMKDAATAMYLSLRELEKKGFLVLTVPNDLKDPDNLSRFESEEKTK